MEEHADAQPAGDSGDHTAAPLPVVAQTLKFYQHSPAWNLPSFDPFCLALHAYLRFLGVPYDVVNCNNPGMSPNNKLPLLFGEDSEVHGGLDSCIQYLANTNRDLDLHLSQEQKGIASAFIFMVEEQLYDATLYNWWEKIENRGIISQLPHYNSSAFPLNIILPRLKAQEISLRFKERTEQQIKRSAEATYAALSYKLGSSDYFFGTKPSSLDAVVFGMMAIHLAAPLSLRSNVPYELASKHQNLLAFCKRILATNFNYDTNLLSVNKPTAPSDAPERNDKALEISNQREFLSSVIKYGVLAFGIGGLLMSNVYNLWNTAPPQV